MLFILRTKTLKSKVLTIFFLFKPRVSFSTKCSIISNTISFNSNTYSGVIYPSFSTFQPISLSSLSIIFDDLVVIVLSLSFKISEKLSRRED